MTEVTAGAVQVTVDVALFPEEPLPFQLVSDDIDQPPPETLYPPTEPLDHDTEIFFEPISEPFFSNVADQEILVGVPCTLAVKVNVPLCSPLEKLVLFKVALAVPVPVPPMVDLLYVTVALRPEAPSKLLGVLQL